MLNSGALTDQVTITPRLGRGGAGVRYGDPVTRWVNLNADYRLARTADGEQTPVDVLILDRPGYGWSQGDKVTLPDGREVTVVSVEVIKSGRRRVSHVEVAAG